MKPESRSTNGIYVNQALTCQKNELMSIFDTSGVEYNFYFHYSKTNNGSPITDNTQSSFDSIRGGRKEYQINKLL